MNLEQQIDRVGGGVKKLRSVNPEEKYRFLAPILLGIAHEFRNPLQGIMASLAAVRCRLGNDVSHEPFLQMIERESLRIDHLIKSMMELAQQKQFDVRPVHIGRVLEDVVRGLAEDMEKKRASVELDIKEPLPWIEGDAQTLSRAFSAVLLNAIESKPHGARVWISATQVDASLQVTIQDDGDGIAPHDLPRVFEPFFSTRAKKVGLGLSIAERILSLHDAEIRLEPDSVAGARVYISFPMKQ